MSAIMDAWVSSLSPTGRIVTAWVLLALMLMCVVAMSLHFVGEFLKGLRQWNEYRDRKRRERREGTS